MQLEEWIEVTKNLIGPTEFRQIGLRFLRDFFGCLVMSTDGTGDGGIDAWVMLRNEPPVRVAAQFHSGKSVNWESKLGADLSAMSKFRDALPADDSRRLDFTKLFFVCSQTPSPIHVETVAQEMQAAHGIAVRVFDAKAIASLAIDQRGGLLDLLAHAIPRDDLEQVVATPFDEVLVAFSMFHDSPSKYRWAVVKSGIATVLDQGQCSLERRELVKQTALLLHLPEGSTLIERALRNLEREQKVEIVEDSIRASAELAERTRTAQIIAGQDRDDLVDRCSVTLEAYLPKGVHHRVGRARRAAEAVLGDLGLLVRRSVVDRAVRAVDDRRHSQSKMDEEYRARWLTIERRLGEEMEIDRSALAQALKDLVSVVAKSTYAKSLSAAELFLRLTEHDAAEFARALDSPTPSVLIDASIAMPMLCALYDSPAQGWQTSMVAHTLYQSLRDRGAACVIPAVYVEEMASHLLLARRFEDIIGDVADIERSGNYFVAHFCSTRSTEGGKRSQSEYREFLHAFGADKFGNRADERADERAHAGHEISNILRRYGFEILDIVTSETDPQLADEPQRPEVLLRHDRAVVRAMRTTTTRTDRRNLVCTADIWLQRVLGELGITALDSGGLSDLLELVRPTGFARSLQSPLLLASAIGEEERLLAAQVWDEIVAIENGHLSDWRLVEKARQFRAQWLAKRRDASTLDSAWTLFRDSQLQSDDNK